MAQASSPQRPIGLNLFSQKDCPPTGVIRRGQKIPDYLIGRRKHPSIHSNGSLFAGNIIR
jgi:hypothetical protein